MIGGCSSACGYCGRCTDAWERPNEPEDVVICDECLRPINVGIVSLQGVGLFCSHKCADRGALKHEAAMSRRSA